MKRKCLDARFVKVVGADLRIAGGHVVDRTCIGDPCEIQIHAEAALITHAAATGLCLRGRELELTHPPCLCCARLLTSSKCGHIWLKKAPSTPDEELAYELLAVSTPVTVGDRPEEGVTSKSESKEKKYEGSSASRIAFPTESRPRRTLHESIHLRTVRTDLAVYLDRDSPYVYPAPIPAKMGRWGSYGKTVGALAAHFDYRAYLLASENLEITENIPEYKIFDILDLFDDMCVILLGNYPILPKKLITLLGPEIFPGHDRYHTWQWIEYLGKATSRLFRIEYPAVIESDRLGLSCLSFEYWLLERGNRLIRKARDATAVSV